MSRFGISRWSGGTFLITFFLAIFSFILIVSLFFFSPPPLNSVVVSLDHRQSSPKNQCKEAKKTKPRERERPTKFKKNPVASGKNSKRVSFYFSFLHFTLRYTIRNASFNFNSSPSPSNLYRNAPLIFLLPFHSIPSFLN
jgi:hypothetical protein